MIKFERRPRGAEALEATRLLFRRRDEEFRVASPEVKKAYTRLRDQEISFAEARAHIAGLPYETLRGHEIELARYSLDRLNALRRGFEADPINPDLESDVRILRAWHYDSARRKFDLNRSIGMCVPEFGIAFVRRTMGGGLSKGERFEPRTLSHELTHLAQVLTPNYGRLATIINEGLTETVAREIMASRGSLSDDGGYQDEVDLISHVRTHDPDTYIELQRHAFTGIHSALSFGFYKRMIEIKFKFPITKRLDAKDYLKELRNA